MKKTTIIISPKDGERLTFDQASIIKEKLKDIVDNDKFNVLIVNVPIDVNVVGDDRINHVQINVDDLEQIIKSK